MPGDWHVMSGGKKRGPLTEDQLRRFAERGTITPDSAASRGPDGPWFPAGRIPGLFAGAPGFTVPAPPPIPVATAVPDHRDGPLEPGPPSPRQDEGERLLWQGRPSQVVNLGKYILCGLFFWLVIPVFIALWRWLEVRCVLYEVTDQRFRITHGVLNRRMDELELYRVKDTVFEQPFFLRIFSLANILIASSDIATPRAAILALPADEARRLRETIRDRVERLRDRKRVREVDYH
ncbi:MAG: DUF4339 domain-containing protein [Planctomycetes bacterium]|nr:DUF4339 domain-containing protein [Planctomycetota bacterium]